MTPEKLKNNLELLRKAITRKPARYDPDSEFAFKFSDSFTKYTRNHVVHLILSLSEMLFEFKWPFPAYVMELSVEKHGKYRLYSSALAIAFILKIKNFFILPNSSLKTQPVNPSPNIEKKIKDSMILYFWLHEKQVFDDWKRNHNFQGRAYIIDNIRTCYKKGLWYACMTASLPLLDLLCRKYINSDKLTTQINKIVKTFKDAGITSRDMKPGHIAWDVAKEQGISTDEASQTDLRLIGIGLGSFLDFASIYYAYCIEDKGIIELNRHAILHCGSVSSDLWTRENTIKIITFIDLMLRLEEPLCILLKDD